MNLYEVLGVDFQATQQEIKDAYRRLAQRYHPDRDTGDKEMFQSITAAYEILGDPELRQRYDETGQAVKPQPKGSVARQILAETLLNHIDLLDPAQVDTIAFVRHLVEQCISRGEATNAGLELQVAKREKILRHIRYKGSGENVLARLLQADIDQKKQQIAHNVARIADHQEALDMLDDYEGSQESLMNQLSGIAA